MVFNFFTISDFDLNNTLTQSFINESESENVSYFITGKNERILKCIDVQMQIEKLAYWSQKSISKFAVDKKEYNSSFLYLSNEKLICKKTWF